MTRLLDLYPPWWRARYGDEMRALMDLAGPDRRYRVDLTRGLVDAWLHPPEPSLLPAGAALLGGGLATTAAVGLIAQPVPPDWPGYLEEVVPLALVAVACLFVAVLGIGIRAADARARSAALAAMLTTAGYAAWVLALAGTVSHSIDSVTLGAAQAVAMVATAVVGLIVMRAGEDRLGSLVLLAAGVMLVPWAGSWLVFGACWTGIGMALIVERST